MTKPQKTDLLVLAFFLSIVDLHARNYYFTGPRPRFQPSPQESAPSPALETTTILNETRTETLKQPGTPYTIYYPLTFPQSRGGRNLNLTLVSKSHPAEHVQPRILNRPELYPYFSISRANFKEVPVSTHPSRVQRFENSPKTQPTNQNPPGNSKNTHVHPLSEKLHKFEAGFGPRPERLDQPGVVNKNFTHPKEARYSVPQQNNKPPVAVSKPQKTIKNPIFMYPVAPQLYQRNVYGVKPSGQQGNAQNWPCFCVPYYLCKNGFINSGGRSVAALKRKTRSFTHDYRNKTNPPPSFEPKVMNAYIVEAVSDSNSCEGNKVCCRLSFEEDNVDDDNHYPVATPPPDPVYPDPPRYPDDEIEPEVCGIRRVYGVQGRLKQLQYSADVAEFGEYPWQVAVLKKVKGEKSLYLCGGVLISPQFVATAAHCVQRDEFSPLLVRLGEWDVNRNDELYRYVEMDVDGVVLHPEFHPETLFNDVALIRMRIPADPRFPHVTPACLPSRGTIYENEKCWVSGWGKDFFGPQGEYQNVLKEVDVPVLGRGLCNEQLRNTNLGPDFTLHPGFLCAGGEAGKDACTGDGGSPLVCRSGPTWYVVGLVSWGIGCGQPGVPGIYVNMLHYIDWIHSVIWR